MKARWMPNCISLDEAIFPVTVSSPQRTVINCLPSNDLEMLFLGTFLCEMDDLDQTPPHQTLVRLFAFEKRAIRA
jgi:hypothetical protein